MNQDPSVVQILKSVPWVLTSDTIANCEVSSLRLENIRADYSTLSFSNCYFEEVIFDFVEHPRMIPNFEDGICETVLCVGDQALHLASFSGCEYETAINREQDLVDQSMTLRSAEEQIVYNLLRKVYDQTGSGRIEKALLSGNAPHLHATVLGVLRNMEKAGFVLKAPGVSNDTIWKGVPGRAGPVRQFLDNPHPKFARQFINLT